MLSSNSLTQNLSSKKVSQKPRLKFTALKAQTAATTSNATKDAVVQKGLLKTAGLYFHFIIGTFNFPPTLSLLNIQ